MRNFTKKVLALVVAVSMLFASVTVVHANEAENPEFLPLRTIFEDAGASVNWGDGTAVIIMPNGDEWVFTPGAQTATLNSDTVQLSTPVVVVNGVSFISFEDIVALFGWHEATYLEPLGEMGATIATAVETAYTFMDLAGITGLTIALVDVETGFTWTQGFGYADSVNGLPVDEHTLFQIGSVSKPFTAVAVMQLVEQGLIDLDAPLVNYIPEFSALPNPALGGDSNDVTVRMLLTNTSGIVGNYLYGWMITGDEQYQGHMNSDLLEWLPTYTLVFPPGTMYNYSNNGWTLLSILVARVMGFDNYFEGFVEHTNATIFAPLGMERSTFEHTAGLTNVAMPYLTLGNQDVMHTTSLLGAGGLFTSAYEMARFMHTIGGNGSLDGQSLLPLSTLAYMMQGHVVATPGVMGYGLGFAQLTIGEHVLTGHDGALIHYHSSMFFDLDAGLGVFVSANTVSGIAIAVPLALVVLEAAITEKTGAAPVFEAPPADDADIFVLSEEELAALTVFEGIYDFGDEGIWEMAIIDNVLTFIGVITFELTPLPDGTFDSIVGNYAFEIIDGTAVATLSVGDVQVVGTKIDSDEEIEFAPPEGFMDWVGTYNFVPQVANEAAIMNQLIIGVNAHGAPTITVVQQVHPYIGGSPEAPLIQYGDYWLASNVPVRFFIDADGNRSIEFMGGLFVKS